LLPPAAAAALLPGVVSTPYMLVPETKGEEWDRLEADVVVPGLCAFFLGVCYEFNRELCFSFASFIHGRLKI